MSASQKTDDVIATTAKISPLLSGKHPDVVGAILADLVSMWLAGHQPRPGVPREKALEARKVILDTWMQLVDRMMPINERLVDAMVKDGAEPVFYYDEDDLPLDRKPN